MNKLFMALLALSAILSGGCVIYEKKMPILNSVPQGRLPAVAVEGFAATTSSVTPSCGTSTTYNSGTAYTAYGPVSYNGTSTTNTTSFTRSYGETSGVQNEIRNALADLGFPVASNNPEYIIVGTIYGTSTNWGEWYEWVSVDIFSLMTCWELNQKSQCEIRVFQRSSGIMVKKSVAEESYKLVSFSIVPLYGHLFVSKMWPQWYYIESQRRAAFKALNGVTEWLSNCQPPPPANLPVRVGPLADATR